MPIEIVKSPLDKRSFSYFRLDNGMRCLLVSDPDADKSAASVDVHVGASRDPRPLYGTAHFLEHMLFQGSEKYPSDSEYKEFIKNNGGYCNAFTSTEDTNFHFEVANEAFEEAIDRMAQFFICPSFSETASSREVNAVDSEFNMSLQNDSWHLQHLKMYTSAEDSLFHQFMCGNLKSLSQPGIRDSLLAFHKKWYSSNIMSLVFCGNQSLETLEKWVRERFTAVENKNVEIPSAAEPAPFPKDNLSKLVKWVPVKDKDVMCLMWFVPFAQGDHKR